MFDDTVNVKNSPGAEDGKRVRLFCSTCRTKTNHTVLGSVLHHWDYPDAGMQGYAKMIIAECAGCESVQFCRMTSDSETFEETTDKSGKISLVYPEKVEQFPIVDMGLFQKPRYFGSIQKEVRDAYEETYKALCNDMPKLAAAGARIVVELVCLAHKIESGTLEEKINELADRGHITRSMKTMLHNVRLFGNRHMHTKRSPDFFELSSAWDAVNNLLVAVYGTSDSNKRFDFTGEIKNKPDF